MVSQGSPKFSKVPRHYKSLHAVPGACIMGLHAVWTIGDAIHVETKTKGRWLTLIGVEITPRGASNGGNKNKKYEKHKLSM